MWAFCQFQFPPFVCQFQHHLCSYSMLGIFTCTRHLVSGGIWRKFPICSVLPCLSHKKIIGVEFRNTPARFASLTIILSTCQIGRHELKNWRPRKYWSLICIVAVLAKTCFDKFGSKVRRTPNNLLPVKTLVRHCSQTIRQQQQ